MAEPVPDIIDFVRRVQGHVADTEDVWVPLRPDTPFVHPIPFFGRIHEAQALTVAMNPSAGEFRGRGWPNSLTPEALSDRLLNYFTNPKHTPYPWFEKPVLPLLSVGLRYTSNLAHVDVVPRATKTIAKEDSPAFRALAEVDAWVFFEALDLARAARVVILMGSVTNAHYVHEWVGRRASRFGWEFGGKPRRERGGPFSAVHTLQRRRRMLDVFFVSPSVNRRGGPRPYERLVLKNRATLRDWLSSG